MLGRGSRARTFTARALKLLPPQPGVQCRKPLAIGFLVGSASALICVKNPSPARRFTQGQGSTPSESERTVTLLTAAEWRDKAEQKMVEAMNAADPRQHHELKATAKAWLELADKIEQAEALEAQAKEK